jgi:dTDP-4-dehydrorhamnose reductase
MSKLVVLGSTGMLGSAVYRLAEEHELDVRGTTTNPAHTPPWFRAPAVIFDGSALSLEAAVADLGPEDHVINCVGLIKHHIDDSSNRDRLRAIALNSELPHRLAALGEDRGFRVVQIATDCVYSGRRGAYSEGDRYDADDVYGMSKALGEVPSSNVMHIRASIIGRELRTHRSLIDWALGQPRDARINGYSDHHWNGVTTVAFARITLGLLAAAEWRPGTFHLVPADAVSKYDLVRHVISAFGRSDIQVIPTKTAIPIDRTLATEDPTMSLRLWEAGGYPQPPSIAGMIDELAAVQGKR